MKILIVLFLLLVLINRVAYSDNIPAELYFENYS